MHGLLGCITQRDKGKSGRRGYGFLGTAAEQVNLRVIHRKTVAEHTGYGINDREDAIFLQQGAEFLYRVQHTAGRVAVNQRRILEVVILLKIIR